MANYTDWNQALIDYFIKGTPHGTKIYLSVDEDVIERIGYHFGQLSTSGTWVDDFCIAVRRKVIFEGQVNLQHLKGRDSQGLPKGVAFLCATILAASQMAQEEKISETNYFKRLREILALPGFARPLGMKFGNEAEEPLWREWNRWLMEDRFLLSAQRGGGAATYINYPISQSLLRRTDKDRLRKLFQEKQWQAEWDAQTLFAHVRREAGGFGIHLKDLLTENKQRHEAIVEALHQVYEQWKAQGCPTADKNNYCTWSRHLFCGLYRTEVPFLDQVDYSLYPKQQRGRSLESVEVKQGDDTYSLREERPGWYFPLECSVSQKELDNGAKYQISSPNDLDYLILPARDFWILIPDPQNPDSGAYASWQAPSLGTQFILLCKQELLSDIQRLRDENLLKSSLTTQPIFNNSGWVELQECMVVSQAWDGVFIKNQTLKYALQPSVKLSISLSGGLRVPKIGAWLVNHGPQITIFGFYSTAELKVTRLSDNQTILESSQSTNTSITLDFAHPDDYLIEATFAGESSQRLVKIVDWNYLDIEKYVLREVMPINSAYHIFGSVIEQNC
ncbi:hypothetical protein CDG76_33985 [Nostoc sp. 'Peltigera membranacea cyanobiont' 210A]|uniref:hypothetical protein n=1 Tax=Nostoc sp. 'Peltigera membranacea cyanobiont' 210A TaxID=2014529 RepID=UPI000B95A2F0|nr:hypothetical protein [Nostoc sp. 'Peltigera membranacea cyanobiont' 210A]OYD89815.1 hypothetical protein CDG76_33985 [Nostoc sp. 'Peltigera membranacea cyanobiont' 210A]